MSEPDASSADRSRRRVLVISGGGAKGAYSFGCLKAFKEHGIRFDVVAGTSAGALNALLWATNSIAEGECLWRNISYDTIYPVEILNPKRHFNVTIRVVASLFVVLRLIWSSLHARHTPGRPLWILLAWLVVGVLVVPALPPGSSQFVFVLLWVMLFPASLRRTALSRVWLPTYLWWALSYSIASFIPDSTFFLLTSLILTLAVLTGAYALARRTVFRNELSVLSSSKLGAIVEETAAKGLHTTTVVTVARDTEIYDPDGTPWVNPSQQPLLSDGQIVYVPGPHPEVPNTRREWVPAYLDITRAKPDLVKLVCLASAALPFGLAPPVKIEPHIYVDGGVADNCPVFPFLNDPTVAEIFVLLLEPYADERKALRKIGIDSRRWAILDRGIRLSKLPAPEHREPAPKDRRPLLRRLLHPRRQVPFRKLSYVPRLILFKPKASLGGFFSGTLRFEAEYARGIMQLGYCETVQNIKQERLAPSSADAALDPSRLSGRRPDMPPPPSS